MNLARVKLVADQGDSYLLHDGKGEFRVPKRGLSDAMHQRIQSFAEGGKVETEAERKKRKQAEYEEETDSTARRPEAKSERLARKRAEYEEETGDVASRPVRDRPASAAATDSGSLPPGAVFVDTAPKTDSLLSRAQRFVEGAAQKILPSAHAASGTSAPAQPRRGYAEGGGVELPERRDAGPIVFVPTPDGGLRPVSAAALRAPLASMPPAAPAPANFTPGPPQMSVPPAPIGPSPEAQAVRQVYETTGPAGAAALGRLADDPLQAGQAIADFQRDERSKLTSLKPRVEGEAPPQGEAPPTAAPSSAPVRGPARGGGAAPNYGLGDMTAAISGEQAALRAKGDAEAAQAAQSAKVLGAVESQLQANALAEKQRREQARIEAQQLGAQRDQLASELKRIDTRVDPGRYWASKSTAQKVLGAIGLALGSIGAGRDGVNRAALLMGQAIDRDIEAQKAEATLTMHKGEQRARQLDSIYAQNRAIYQDDLSSLAASKATALELADNQLKQSAATYASPIAKANAAALSAQLQTSIAKFKAQAAQQAEERRHHMALEGAAAAKGAGGLPAAEQGKVFDIASAAGNIRRNIDKAKAIIARSGTMELIGTDETELRSALGEAAQDWARMRDPGGTVKEAELANAKKQIGVEGGEFWTRNSTALKLLQDFEKGIDAREDLGYRVRGLAPPERKKKP